MCQKVVGIKVEGGGSESLDGVCNANTRLQTSWLTRYMYHLTIRTSRGALRGHSPGTREDARQTATYGCKEPSRQRTIVKGCPSVKQGTVQPLAWVYRFPMRNLVIQTWRMASERLFCRLARVQRTSFRARHSSAPPPNTRDPAQPLRLLVHLHLIRPFLVVRRCRQYPSL
jgi:hypothetical protein